MTMPVNPVNIFAYTANNPKDPTYPEFVSMNVVDGKFQITVRGPKKSDESCGDVATCTLPLAEIVSMINAPFKALMELGKNGRLIVPAT